MNAVRLWKLRQRFGIAAPRVAVRTHVPWYLRWLALVLLLACSAALAAWMYDAGRRYAGFDRSEVDREIAALKRDLAASREELERLGKLANAAESKISIERTAQQNLARQVRALEGENARLREELAVFERTLSADPKTSPPLAIQRFKVQPELLPGEYRYHLLVLAPGGRAGDFQGRYELLVSVAQDGRNVMMALPEAGSAATQQEFRLAFKRFQRIEGTFRVNPAARVESVQVRIYESGSGQSRATQTAKLG
ncbi:MAG: hypothetical protein EPO29_03985 [Betaproteobacteria bacterium]|nr:MAG: hypothetical protein EPO29_03985 [Betaproteobacteria bacterium]